MFRGVKAVGGLPVGHKHLGETNLTIGFHRYHFTMFLNCIGAIKCSIMGNNFFFRHTLEKIINI